MSGSAWTPEQEAHLRQLCAALRGLAAQLAEIAQLANLLVCELSRTGVAPQRPDSIEELRAAKAADRREFDTRAVAAVQDAANRGYFRPRGGRIA